MDKRHRPRRRILGESVSFSIVRPAANEVVTADSAGRISVQIDDGGSNNGFAAKIFSFSTGGGIGTSPISASDFGGHVSSGLRDIPMSVGTVDLSVAGNNRVVQAEDKGAGRIIGHPFRAVPLPSGSGSSGSRITREFQLRFCRPGQLVPVALTLKLDSRVAKGTCAKCTELNRPTLLLHSDEAKRTGCWYSRPIAFCGKSAPAGYWVLERNSATAWTLVLKQGDTVLVTFTAKTKPKDCSLPIKLQRKGAGSKVCKDWPKTVSISPAS